MTYDYLETYFVFDELTSSEVCSAIETIKELGCSPLPKGQERYEYSGIDTDFENTLVDLSEAENRLSEYMHGSVEFFYKDVAVMLSIGGDEDVVGDNPHMSISIDSANIDKQSPEGDVNKILNFLKEIFENVEPLYGFSQIGISERSDLPILSGQEFKENRIPEFFWTNFLGERVLDTDRVRDLCSMEVWRNEELENGGRLIVLTKDPYRAAGGMTKDLKDSITDL